MVEVSGNSGELPDEAASGLSDGLGMDRDKKIMLFALKEALKEVVAAVVECEEARDTAERRLNRLKEQEASLRGLIRERWRYRNDEPFENRTRP